MKTHRSMNHWSLAFAGELIWVDPTTSNSPRAISQPFLMSRNLQRTDHIGQKTPISTEGQSLSLKPTAGVDAKIAANSGTHSGSLTLNQTLVRVEADRQLANVESLWNYSHPRPASFYWNQDGCSAVLGFPISDRFFSEGWNRLWSRSSMYSIFAGARLEWKTKTNHLEDWYHEYNQISEKSWDSTSVLHHHISVVCLQI